MFPEYSKQGQDEGLCILKEAEQLNTEGTSCAYMC